MRSSERLPTVLRDVLGDETLLDLLDIAVAGGELIHELQRHPRELPRGCAPRTTLTSLPPDTEDLGEAVGEDSVVMLREPCDGSVQRSGIERAPLPIRHRLHSVRDHITDRSMMSTSDQGLRSTVGDGPQGGDGFRDGERQIKA